MPSLKDLRNRIRSVKSTQKITSAMKMVSAAKLRRAQEQAVASRPYAERLERMIAALGARVKSGAPPLLSGNGSDRKHLILVATADRGLCGPFNASIVREARNSARRLMAEGKEVKLLFVGRKGRDAMKRDFAKQSLGLIELSGGKGRIAFADADAIGKRLIEMFTEGEIDVASVVYARFKSAISQTVTRQQLIPAPLPEAMPADEAVPFEYEPDEEAILKALLPRNLSVQIYRAMLENAASEQGARMTAMDSATRNAGEMIDKLTLNYNRTRQAYITRELIEIISGAQAV